MAVSLSDLIPASAAATRTATPRGPSMSEQEQNSMMRDLFGYPVSVLGGIGQVLDLPGSSVRDLLTGNNPLDQWIDPLNPSKKIEGRDMLRQWGVVGDEDNWGNFGTGLAAEVLLDPTTYLTLGAGAGTKLFKAFKKVNRPEFRKALGKGAAGLRVGGTPDDLLKMVNAADNSRAFKGKTFLQEVDEAAAQSLGWKDYLHRTTNQLPAGMKPLRKGSGGLPAVRGSGGLTRGPLSKYGFDNSTPFTKQRSGLAIEALRKAEGESLGSLARFAGKPIGVGSKARKIAAFTDDLADKLGNTGIGKIASKAFNAETGGILTPIGSTLARMTRTQDAFATNAIRRTTRKLLAERDKFVDPAGKAMTQGNYLQAMEVINKLGDDVDNAIAVSEFIPDNMRSAFSNHHREVHKLFSDLVAQGHAIGNDITEFTADFMLEEGHHINRYFPHMSESFRMAKGGSGKAGKMFDTLDPHNKMRNQAFRGAPEGMKVFREMFDQGTESGREILKRVNHLRDMKQKHGATVGRKSVTKNNAGKLTGGVGEIDAAKQEVIQAFEKYYGQGTLANPETTGHLVKSRAPTLKYDFPDIDPVKKVDELTEQVHSKLPPKLDNSLRRWVSNQPDELQLVYDQLKAIDDDLVEGTIERTPTELAEQRFKKIGIKDSRHPVSGLPQKQWVSKNERIIRKYYDGPKEVINKRGEIEKVGEEAGDRFDDLAEIYSNFTEDELVQGLFSNDPLKDLEQRLISGYESMNVAKVGLKLFADHALNAGKTSIRGIDGTYGDAGISIKKMLNTQELQLRAGDETAGAVKEIASHLQRENKLRPFYNAEDVAKDIPMPMNRNEAGELVPKFVLNPDDVAMPTVTDVMPGGKGTIKRARFVTNPDDIGMPTYKSRAKATDGQQLNRFDTNTVEGRGRFREYQVAQSDKELAKLEKYQAKVAAKNQEKWEKYVIRKAAKETKLLNKEILEEVLDLQVPKDLVNAMQKIREGHMPQSDSPARAGLDSFTSWFKGINTVANSTFPMSSFAVRNFVAGQYANFVAGSFSLRSLRDSMDFFMGNTVKGSAQYPAVRRLAHERGMDLADLSDEAATGLLKDLAYETNVLGPNLGNIDSGAMEMGNLRPDRMSDVTPVQFPEPTTVPGNNLASQMGNFTVKTGREFLALEEGLNFNPYATRGTGTAETFTQNFHPVRTGPAQEVTKFGPMKAGEGVNGFVESTNRGTPWLHDLRKGASADDAALKANALQVDYSWRQYTQTERDYLTRLFPFYKWTSKMLPWSVKQLATKPGGTIAKTIRTQNRLTSAALGESGYVPERLQQGGVAIPLGDKDAEGNRYWLSKIDLPHEGAFSPFKLGQAGRGMLPFLGGTAKESTRGIMSAMHPLVKAPIEFATGKRLYDGRDLERLDGGLARIYSNIGEILESTTGVQIPEARILTDFKKNGVENLLWSSVGTPLNKLRQVTDVREYKAGAPGIGKLLFNLSTGGRITNINEDQVKEIEAQIKLSEILGDEPHVRQFTNQYIRKEDLDKVPTKYRSYLELLNSLRKTPPQK